MIEPATFFRFIKMIIISPKFMTLLVRTFNTRHERPFNSQQFKSEDFDHAFSRMILNIAVSYGTIRTIRYNTGPKYCSSIVPKSCHQKIPNNVTNSKHGTILAKLLVGFGRPRYRITTTIGPSEAFFYFLTKNNHH